LDQSCKNTKKIITCTQKKLCQPSANDTTKINSVRTLSRTILVVADISLVTVIPAKLKNAILKIVPVNKKTQEHKIISRISSLISHLAKITILFSNVS
jgi:hypothetical protein